MKFIILNEPNQNSKIDNNLLMTLTGNDEGGVTRNYIPHVKVRSLFSKKIIKSKL